MALINLSPFLCSPLRERWDGFLLGQKRGSLGCIGDTNPVRFWHHTLIECSKQWEPVGAGEHPPVHAVESRRTEFQSTDLIGVMGRRDLGTRKDGRAWAGDHARELIPFWSDSGSMHRCSS